MERHYLGSSIRINLGNCRDSETEQSLAYFLTIYFTLSLPTVEDIRLKIQGQRFRQIDDGFFLYSFLV